MLLFHLLLRGASCQVFSLHPDSVTSWLSCFSFCQGSSCPLLEAESWVQPS